MSIRNTANVFRRRNVYGSRPDEPLVWYEGLGTGDKRWLVADERGSVIAVTNASGAAIDIKSYDAYGVPHDTAPANAGRFGYTGQAWLPGAGLNYYKARMYSPVLGRFLQADPIGYGDGLNLYGYVGSDPVNRTDPSGLLAQLFCSYHDYSTWNGTEVVIQSYQLCVNFDIGGGGGPGNYLGGGGGREKGGVQADPVVPTTSMKVPQSVARHRGQRAKRISPCMRGFLSSHALGYDWDRTVITGDAPMWGSDASTSVDTINVGGLFNSFESDKGLFFHEVAHMPQWASGSLTLRGYIGSAAYNYVRSGFDKSVAHGSIPWEAEANGVSEFLGKSYDAAGKPCG